MTCPNAACELLLPTANLSAYAVVDCEFSCIPGHSEQGAYSYDIIHLCSLLQHTAAVLAPYSRLMTVSSDREHALYGYADCVADLSCNQIRSAAVRALQQA